MSILAVLVFFGLMFCLMVAFNIVFKEEHVLFRIFGGVVFGYFATVAVLQTFVNLAKLFGWNF